MSNERIEPHKPHSCHKSNAIIHLSHRGYNHLLSMDRSAMDAGQRYGDHPMLKLGELTPVLGVVAPAAAMAV